MLNRKHIRRRFERAAGSFDGADFVHAATRDGLLSRLKPLLIDAKTVVDLGAATGSTTRSLQQRFRSANVIAVDFTLGMLRIARAKKRWLSNATFVQADASALPFANGCVDVVFCNMLLPWIDDPTAVFTEVARILKKGGVFAFATLGPDSLREIERAWGQVDSNAHVNRFPDMHDFGDSLVNAGLCDPVLDVDRLAISYDNCERLFADLTAVGARNALQQRARSLTGKQRFGAMVAALDDAFVDGKLCLDLELVYGHCWGAGPRQDATAYRIDPADIALRRK